MRQRVLDKLNPALFMTNAFIASGGALYVDLTFAYVNNGIPPVHPTPSRRPRSPTLVVIDSSIDNESLESRLKQTEAPLFCCLPTGPSWHLSRVTQVRIRFVQALFGRWRCSREHPCEGDRRLPVCCQCSGRFLVTDCCMILFKKSAAGVSRRIWD